MSRAVSHIRGPFAPTLGALFLLLPGAGAPEPLAAQRPAGETDLAVETLVEGLDTPWDLAWGPDGSIWVTERRGVVLRVDPETGDRFVAGEVPEVYERGEAGLMGIAFHPDFDREPWVYLAHSYRAPDGIRNRLIRMRWKDGRLGGARTLLDGIPGRSNHDGSRLAFGPGGLLHMTTGDAGRPRLAQDRTSLAGKILRVTTTGAPAPGNPLGTAVFTWGHRNPQGIVFHPETARLYISEHGPSENDEVSLVRPAADHGWPAVHGRCDGDVRGEVEYCRTHRVVEAIATWTPTVAVAGADLYLGDAIAGWDGDLLVTSLRGETLWRLELSGNGRRVTSRDALFRGRFGRLRDVLVGPDGAVYLATSNRDGRGRPDRADDRILKITPAASTAGPRSLRSPLRR